MLTKLREDKLDRAFERHLDRDGDGEAHYEDLLSLAARILAAFGESPDGPKGSALINACAHFWEILLAEMDLDHERRITAGEWRHGMHGAFIAKGGGFDHGMRPMVQAVLAVVDTDGDGFMTRAEFETFHTACYQSDDDTDVAFRKLDANGDGHLTVDELVDACHEYYTSDDPDAAGNWLWGHIDTGVGQPYEAAVKA